MKTILKSGFLVLWLLFLSLPESSEAQTTTAITGLVTDSMGARIAKAIVTLHNQDTNQNLTTQTTTTGNFTFPGLRPGIYDVTASSAGFETATEVDVRLHLDAVASVSLQLKPGAAKDTITVRADEILMDVTHPSLGETFSQDEIEQSPLNSGNPLLLANAEPGVTFQGTNESGASWVRPFDHLSINQFSVNGGISGSNDFELDGSPNNTIQFGNRDISYVPPVASVQEMKFIANPYDAQYGHTGGGVFDIVTKYGTNKNHGQVYYNARRTWLDANTELNNAQQLAKGSDVRNIWGVQLDGPLVIPHFYDGHDKTFFELEVQRYMEKDPQSGVASVPALSPGSTTQPAWETGDFSGAFYWNGSGNSPETIYNPYTLNGSAVNTSVNWPGTGARTAFPNNFISPVMMDSTARAILSYLPLPNRTTPASQSWGADNYAWESEATLPFDNVVARLDRNFTDKDRTYIRFSWQKNWQNNGDAQTFNSFSSGAISRSLNPLVFQTHHGSADWQHTFSSNSLLGVHVSGDRFAYNQNQGKSPYNLSQIGLGGLAPSVTEQVFPQISIGGVGGVTEFGNNADNGGNKLTITNSISAMPMWTYIHGSQSLKVGLDYRLQRSSTYYGGAASGEFADGCFWTAMYNYNSCITGTGSGLASFVLGIMDSGSIYTGVRQYFTYPYYAPFLQDDWKLNKKLTINLGLRWDFQVPPSESANKIVGAFDSTDMNPVNSVVAGTGNLPTGVTLRGGMTFAGVNGQSRNLFRTNRALLQPRIGFNYALNDKTVVRGGIGSTYVQFTGQGYDQGFTASTGYISSTNYGQSTYGGTLLSNPFPTVAKPYGSSLGMESGLGSGFSVVNPAFSIPGVLNYSLGVERQIGEHSTIFVSYVGNRGFNMDSSDNINHISAAYSASCNLEMGASTTEYANCINTWNDRSVTNPFQGVSAFSTTNTGNPLGYYTSSTLNASVFSRPYPQFGDITETEHNEGHSEYDSLQVVVTHRWSNALTFHGNFVWSKQMDGGWWNDTVYRIRQHYLDKVDRPWRIAANADWHMPVGRGRTYLGASNRLVDAVVGGWTMGAVYNYDAGTPSGVGMPFESRFEGYNLEVVRKQHYGVHNRTEIQRVIRGSSKCVGWYDPNPALDDVGGLSVGNAPYTLSDVSGNDYAGCEVNGTGTGHVYDYILRPSYGAVQNVSDSGVRNPRGQNLDLSMSKNFTVWQQYKLELRFEGYNVENHPTWDGLDYWWDPWDPHFGTINKYYDGQTNIPRNVQLSAKITW